MSTQALEQRLDAMRDAGSFSPDVINAFRVYLESAPEEDVFRASPLRYAAASGITEDEAIALFLHAAHAGILEFAWGFLCPACVAFLTTAGGLRSLQQRKTCNFCEIDIVGPIDNQVEVGFTVSPAVRRLRLHSPDTLDLRRDALTLFFSTSIARDSPLRQTFSDNLLMLGRAQSEAAQEEEVTLGPGRYLLIVPMSHAVLHLNVIEREPAGASAQVQAQGQVIDVDILPDRTVPGEVTVGAGAIPLRVMNRMTKPVVYMLLPCPDKSDPSLLSRVIRHTSTVRPYLTGPRLISSQIFRELFRAESIPSEGGLELKSVTVLFTDLKGSTAIYENVGDLRAYDLVRKHFTVLRDIVAARGGAIVKTIGDAVMASFSEPASAMRAAIAMHREVEAIGEGTLSLKIGVHTGRCIAVELNDRLDYFGRTVNVAARVQGIAEAGEIVCTPEVFESPGVPEAMATAGLAPRRTSVPLKGIEGSVDVIRLG